MDSWFEVALAANVAEHRSSAGVRDRVGRGDEVERRKYHLVSGCAAGAEQGEMERRGAVRDGECVARPDVRRERRFELLDARPHRPPARGESVAGRAQDLVVDEEIGQRHLPGERGVLGDATWGRGHYFCRRSFKLRAASSRIGGVIRFTTVRPLRIFSPGRAR